VHALYAAHMRAQRASSHAGAAGVHTTAPSSISPSLKRPRIGGVPHEPLGTFPRPLLCHLLADPGRAGPLRAEYARDIPIDQRHTLPERDGRDRAAVYRRPPGNARIAANSVGKPPVWISTIAFAAACRCFARR